MTEFDADGRRYRARLLCAAEQWTLLSRLRTILPALAGMDFGLRVEGAAVEDIAAALTPLLQAPDEDVKAVFTMARRACEHEVDGAWCAIDEVPPFAVLMRITTEVIAENFGLLFAMERVKFRPVASDRVVFDPVQMNGGEDWLWRPVLRGLCKAESLYDGVLRIEIVAKMNDALDVLDENEARARKAAENQRPKR